MNCTVVMRNIKRASIGLCALIAGCSLGRQASAQLATVQNQYIKLDVDLLSYLVVSENRTVPARVLMGVGRTGLLTIPGQGIDLGSYPTVRIDGGTPPAAATGLVPGWDFRWGEIIAGQTQWVLAPTAFGDRIVAKWATIAGTVAPFPLPPIQVDMEARLIHDMVQFKFTVHNGIPDANPAVPSSGTHNVGIRFVQNYRADTISATVKEGPIQLPVGPEVTTEKRFLGGDVPAWWKVYDGQNGTPVGGILKTVTSDESIVTPDEFAVAASNIMTELWDHVSPNIPGLNFATDLWDACVALYWYPRYMAAGSSPISFVTYFGQQNGVYDFAKPWAAGLSGPHNLTIDATKPQGSNLVPSPFDILSFVYNYNDLNLSNVTATLSLPQGLVLGSGETAVKGVPLLAPNSEIAFGWKVLPDYSVSGILKYSVTFSAGPGSHGKVVTNQIEVPALPRETLAAGLQMASFPYQFANPNPSVALGLDPSSFDLLRWNPVTLSYQVVDQLVPGQAYWMNVRNGQTINLVGATPIPTSAPNFEIQLNTGWQQISNPYVYGIRWAEAQVVSSDANDPDYLKPISISEAAQKGWVASTIFWFDMESKDYRYGTPDDLTLSPYLGYWFRAYKGSLSLLLPKPTGRAIKTVSRSMTPLGTGWSFRLSATSNGKTDGWNFFGLRNGNSRVANVEKPPVMANHVALNFVREIAGKNTSLAADMQSAGAGKRLWLAVVSELVPRSDVVIGWSPVGSVSRAYDLTLLDQATGARINMRQTSSYKFQSGAATTRQFAIIAEPRTAGLGLHVSAMVVPEKSRAAGMAQIVVNATQNATIGVRVIGVDGRIVRDLTGGRSVSAGVDQSFVWDQRNSQGIAVPSGVYTFEVRATTTDGSAAKNIVTYVVRR